MDRSPICGHKHKGIRLMKIRIAPFSIGKFIAACCLLTASCYSEGASVHACMRACVRACVRACLCVCVVYMCVYMGVV